MPKRVSTETDLRQSLQIIGKDLEVSINFLLRSIGRIDDEELNDSQKSATLLSQAVGISVNSINILLINSEMGARDCLSISRSICEAAVNVAYLLIGDSEVTQKALRYTAQRIHRENSRSVSLAGLSLSIKSSVQVEMAGIDGLDDAINEFTRASGSEIREWSGKNIDQKIEFIFDSLPACANSLAASRIAIYGISSEILHGSPFGAFYFWTALTSRPTILAARDNMTTHFSTALAASVLAFDGMVQAWRYNLNRPLLEWNSAEVFETFRKALHVEFEDAAE
jgi:hypothetical protein